eukprot:TRINITY_DN44375_c0_g1_i1.p1 TRINITY_DN44375_c0_g1~~TRINITY_DN44375_c0_g1_i1.p1  ORF type:complete len:722 (+),score=123.89 TRINITY_DN44375_c0_g1_i1:154-2319(+)
MHGSSGVPSEPCRDDLAHCKQGAIPSRRDTVLSTAAGTSDPGRSEAPFVGDDVSLSLRTDPRSSQRVFPHATTYGTVGPAYLRVSTAVEGEDEAGPRPKWTKARVGKVVAVVTLVAIILAAVITFAVGKDSLTDEFDVVWWNATALSRRVNLSACAAEFDATSFLAGDGGPADVSRFEKGPRPVTVSRCLALCETNADGCGCAAMRFLRRTPTATPSASPWGNQTEGDADRGEILPVTGRAWAYDNVTRLPQVTEVDNTEGECLLYGPITRCALAAGTFCVAGDESPATARTRSDVRVHPQLPHAEHTWRSSPTSHGHSVPLWEVVSAAARWTWVWSVWQARSVSRRLVSSVAPRLLSSGRSLEPPQQGGGAASWPPHHLPASCTGPTASEAAAEVRRVRNAFAAVSDAVKTLEDAATRGWWEPLLLALGLVAAQTFVVTLVLPATPLNLLTGYLFVARPSPPSELGACMTTPPPDPWSGAHVWEQVGWLAVASTVSTMGIFCSGVLSFLLARYLAYDATLRVLTKYPKFLAVARAVGRSGFTIVFLVTLAPAFPAGICHYLFGITPVGFWPFAGATMLGLIPGTVALTYLGTKMHQIVDMFTTSETGGTDNFSVIMLILTVVVTVLAVVIVSWVAARALRAALAADEDVADVVVDLSTPEMAAAAGLLPPPRDRRSSVVSVVPPGTHSLSADAASSLPQGPSFSDPPLGQRDTTVPLLRS